MDNNKDIAQEIIEVFRRHEATAGEAMAAISYIAGVVAYESGITRETAIEGMIYSIRLIYEAKDGTDTLQ